MRRVLRIVLRVLAGIGVVIVVGLAILCIVYPPEYVFRLIRWGNADVFDYQKFGAHPVQNAPPVFRFKEAEDRAAAEASVREVFEQDLQIDDLDAFLAEKQTQAFIVIKDDTILYEKYFNGTTRDSIVTSFSVAKSFDSAMIGAAIADGKIGSADDPITRYLPELAARDPRFEAITIRHLLMMSSGIHYVEYPFFTSDDALTYYFTDLRSLALNQTRIEKAPGESFLYNNYNPLLEGIILERATGMTVAEYLQESLWEPLGMEYPATWSIDSEATQFEKMESGINARAIDFAKLGRLYLNGGNWEGKQVIPAEWVAQSIELDETIDRERFFPEEFRSPGAERGYQLHWWGVLHEDGSYDAVASGNFGQMIYISPAHDLIIVRNGISYAGVSWFALVSGFVERFGGS